MKNAGVSRHWPLNQVLIEAGTLARCLCCNPSDGAHSSCDQLIFLLLLARLRELRAWISSAQLSRLFWELQCNSGVAHSIRIARLRKALAVIHVCMTGDADTRAIVNDKEDGFEEELLLRGALRHKVPVIIASPDSQYPDSINRGRARHTSDPSHKPLFDEKRLRLNLRRAAEENSEGEPRVMSAQEYLDLLERQLGITYAMVTMPR